MVGHMFRSLNDLNAQSHPLTHRYDHLWDLGVTNMRTKERGLDVLHTIVKSSPN